MRGVAPRHSAARSHELDEEYLKRMEACSFERCDSQAHASNSKRVAEPFVGTPWRRERSASNATNKPQRDRTNNDAFFAREEASSDASIVSKNQRMSWSHELDVSERPILCGEAHVERVAFGGSDHDVHVLDVKKKTCMKLNHPRNGHKEWLTCVRWLPGGRILSGSMDRHLCMWSMHGNRCEPWHGHEGTVSEALVSRDGRMAITSSYDKTIRIWDAEESSSDRKLGVLRNHQAPVLVLRRDVDRRVASGCRGGKVSVSDFVALKEVWKKKDAHGGHVTSLEWLDPNVLVTGGQDGYIRLWDGRSPSSIQNLPSHRERRGSGAIGFLGTSGDMLVSAGADGRVNVHSIKKDFGVLYCHRTDDFVYSALVDGSNVFVGLGSGLCDLLDLKGLRRIQNFRAHSAGVRYMGIVGKRLVTAGDDGNVAIFEAHSMAI